MHPVRFTLLAALAASPASAQDALFTSPGQSTYSNTGQTTRFSTDFNPAWGIVVDALADYQSFDDPDMPDGFDASLRLLEFNASAQAGPDLWGYVVLASHDAETPEIEEAAVVYTGFDDAGTIKAGRFFVDFGKQMTSHLEELRTLERPLVLRELLGEELAGTGVQYDDWWALGDETPVRASVAIFGDLGGGHDHGDEDGHGHEEEGEEEHHEAEMHVPDRHDFDALGFAARVTGMRDVGDNGQIQLGVSTRVVPDFDFEAEGEEATGLSNIALGFDATYGWTDDTGLDTWTGGFEFVRLDGDLSAEFDEDDGLEVRDDDVDGFFVFLDHGWEGRHNVGVQFSHTDLPEEANMEGSELDLYYTWHMTELRRLRFGVTMADIDPYGDSIRGYVQFTNFFGSHQHGVNW